MRRVTVSCGWILAAAASAIMAAAPPELINYQGVVRDASGTPLNGSYDMTFRLFDAATAGNEILVDEHLASMGQAVDAANGLFSTPIGGGNVTDGSGPGTYTGLTTVFADHDDVWLEIQIGTEILSPRVRVLSAAFAQSAARLEGRAAAEFLDISTSQQIKPGTLVVGSATPSGGLFGLEGYGTEGGGYFKDADGSGYAYAGHSDTGVVGLGNAAGGFFQDANSSAYAYAGYGDRGVEAYGNEAGGYFKDLDGSGYAFLGKGDFGVEGHGGSVGGYFTDLNGSGAAFVGTGDRGVQGFGNEMGAYFADGDQSGYAYVGHQDTGVVGYGNAAGGFFQDANSAGYVYLGYGDRGVEGYGDDAGGAFYSLGGTGWARVGASDTGISARGSSLGGYFGNTSATGGYARLADPAYGIWADGDVAGARFHNKNANDWVEVANSTYKIQGPGGVSFVQNHPQRQDRVIVYVAPEGDEVAVYTRGSARLAGGIARVRLGETFQWVTNPDIGLTAYVTPRGECNGVYVESVTPQELVVRELGGGQGDVVFDYIVYGLRIGFEEVSIVQEKRIESMIPSMTSHRERYDRHPELRVFNALERFKDSRLSVDETELDLSGADALKAAIGEYDPAVHGPPEAQFGYAPPPVSTAAEYKPPRERALSSPEISQFETESAATRPSVAVAGSPARASNDRAAEEEHQQSWNTAWMPASGPVEGGDVLAFDPERPGKLKPGESLADARVAGVAAGPAVERGGELQVPIAVAGLVSCKVDAGYGAIQPGDQLTASPTPGHAMRALESLPGTIVGKATEAFESGTGKISVLVVAK